MQHERLNALPTRASPVYAAGDGSPGRRCSSHAVEREWRVITLLFEVGHLYHRAVLDPLYEVFRQDPQYEIAFICSHDAERRFGLFNRSLRSDVEAHLRAEGLRTADNTRGFDVVITGDTIRKPQRYGQTLLCFVNHGTGIKNLGPQHLQALARTRYQVFVEGQYRMDAY